MKTKARIALIAAFACAFAVAAQPNDAANKEQTDSAQSQPIIIAPNPQDKHDCGAANDLKAANGLLSVNASAEQHRWWSKSDWWVVIVAALTGGVVGWQSYETRKAAKAALIQANHLANSERAWIVVEPGNISDDFDPDPLTLEIMYITPVFRNYGKTMGHIIRTSIRTHEVSFGQQLPPTPDYQNIADIDIRLPEGPVVQPIRTAIDLKEFIQFREGKEVLYVYGFVDYVDFAEVERRCRFCFEYFVPSGFASLKRGFYMAVNVPRTYTQST